MSTMRSMFGQAVQEEIAALRVVQPRTAAQVVAVLRVYDPADPDARDADAAFSAAEGDMALANVLVEAGWTAESLGVDCFLLSHPESGSTLGYFAGLVYAEPELFAATA